MIQLLDLDGKKGDSALLSALVVNLHGAGVGRDVDWGDGTGEEVKKVAQRSSEGKTVPDCIDNLGRTTEGARGGGEGKKVGETVNAEET